MKKLVLTAVLAPALAFGQALPTPTFSSMTLQNPLTATNGGTGVANSSTITLGGNLVTSGANPLTLTTTGSTNVTLPTNGTLLNGTTGATAGANSNITSLSGLTTPLSVPQGGTGSATSTGSGSVVLATSPTLTTPALGTPSAAVLTNATGLPISTGVSGLGTGVATGLASAVTGSGGPVLATSPTISGLSATNQNIAYTTTYSPGTRAPLFIWQNPNGSTAAGTNAGQQIWIGNNPTATPAANDTVASTIAVTNGNSRANLYGQNLLVGICGTAEGCTTGYLNAPVQGQEIDVYGSASFTPANQAFNPTAGTYVVNGQQVYCQGNQYCTSAYSAWSTGSTGQNWFKEGLSLDRIYQYGIHFNVTAGDTATGFGGAAIQDDSNSTVTLEIGSGTHTYYINAPNFQVTGAGLLTAGSGIAGTTTNNNANAGSVGEYVTAAAGATGIITATNTNITSISLTAGDWDVEGVIQFTPTGTTVTLQTTTAISTTSATIGAVGTFTTQTMNMTGGNGQTMTSPVTRLSLSSTTTVYLVGLTSFNTSTMTAAGFIRARRVR